MHYEIKIYTLKWISKSESKGNVYIHKIYQRWVKVASWCYSTKKEAISDLKAFLLQDKNEKDLYKYTICMKKGGAKRVKR